MFFQPASTRALRQHSHCDGLSNLSIQFSLEGLAISERSTEVDLYLPQTRHGTYTPGVRTHEAIEQRSTSSVWKGPIKYIREIYHWEKCLQACLENLLSMTMIAEFRKAAQRQILKWKPPTIGKWLCYFANHAGRRTFHILLEDLLSEMIELYNNEFADADQSVFASGGDLRNSLCEFLRTHDCFQELEGVYVKIDIDLYAQSDGPGKVKLSGIATWKHPNITFPDSNPVVSPGTSYFLIPRYEAPLITDVYPSDVGPEYCIDSDHLPWQWNTGKQGFFCKAPANRVGQPDRSQLRYSAMKSHFEAISDIKALLISHFPGSMKFERISRIRIRTDIVHEALDPLAWYGTAWKQEHSAREQSVHQIPRYVDDDDENLHVQESNIPPSYSATLKDRHGADRPAVGGSLRVLRENASGKPAKDRRDHHLPSLSHIPAMAMAKDHQKRMHQERKGFSTVHGYPLKANKDNAQPPQNQSQWQSLVMSRINSRRRRSAQFIRDVQETVDTAFDPNAPNASIWPDLMPQETLEIHLSSKPQPIVHIELSPSLTEDDVASEDDGQYDAYAHEFASKIMTSADFSPAILPESKCEHAEASTGALRIDSFTDAWLNPDIDSSPIKEQDVALVGMNILDGTQNDVASLSCKSRDVEAEQSSRVANPELTQVFGDGRRGNASEQPKTAIKETKLDQQDIRNYFEQCLAKKTRKPEIEPPAKSERDMEEEKVYESFFLENESSGANSPSTAMDDDDEDSILGSSMDSDVDVEADRE